MVGTHARITKITKATKITKKIGRRLRTGMWLGAAIFAFAVALSARQPAPSRADQPVFRAGVQVIEVDVRVFDRNGRFVADLARDDFEVLEKGVPQRLQTVYLVGEMRPGLISGAAPEEIRPGLISSTVPVPVPASRQTWIFVFDLNHLAPGASFERARKAVEEYIRDRFQDGDLGGIVAGTKMVNNRLTSVREELVAGVRTIKPASDARSRHMELTREWPRILDEHEAIRIANNDKEAIDRAVIRACSEDQSACGNVPPDLQLREKARRLQGQIERATMETLVAINALASGLAKMPGPKTIVLLTDGFVTQDIETTLRQVVGQTARAGARIYAIDVRGLNRGRGAGIIDQAQVVDEAGAPAQFEMGEDGPNSLAIDTGGLMIRNENNIGRALERVAADANRYYILGYQPEDADFDGTFRPIDVRVKREGVRVRARRGYLALETSKMLVPQPIPPGSER
jgi:VWFA-related protein